MWGSWGRILLAVGVYFLFAALSVLAVRLLGGDLKRMEGRARGFVPLVGMAANLLILAAVLALLALADRKPVAVLGLGFGLTGLAFTASSAILTPLLAWGFVRVLGRSTKRHVERRRLRAGGQPASLAVAAVALLLAVALQEEVLFRGYVTVNLARMSPLAIITISSALFVLIHFPTNRVSLPQVGSWVAGGLLLALVYLVSGSIWVAVAVHFVTDYTNVLAFDVAGAGSLYSFEPSLGAGHRALFRLVQGLLTVAILLAFYGARFHLQVLG
jgi:membrane protease YdiL (CAAX protease family)